MLNETSKNVNKEMKATLGHKKWKKYAEETSSNYTRLMKSKKMENESNNRISKANNALYKVFFIK